MRLMNYSFFCSAMNKIKIKNMKQEIEGKNRFLFHKAQTWSQAVMNKELCTSASCEI